MPTERNFNPLFAFENMESNVRSYSRSFPVVFRRLWEPFSKTRKALYISTFSRARALLTTATTIPVCSRSWSILMR